MSRIEIICRKGYEKRVKGNDDKHAIDNELIIRTNQLFMNTEKFFNSVKESLENYFGKIEKK